MFDIYKKYADFGSFLISEYGAFDYAGHTYMIGGSMNKYSLVLHSAAEVRVRDELEIDSETGKVSKDQVIILLEPYSKYDANADKYLIKYFVICNRTVLATGYIDREFDYPNDMFESAAEVLKRDIDKYEHDAYD